MASRTRWLCAGLLAIGIASVVNLVAHSYRAAARQKDAISVFSQSIHLEMPRKEAERRCKQACVDDSEWAYYPIWEGYGFSGAEVRSPLTLGAQNWVVYLVFEDDIVAAVLVRTADSPRLRPHGSPPDRARDTRASWLAHFAQD
jgi:hypothetical protein